MDLSGLSDGALTERLKAAVSVERRCSEEVMRLLAEAGRRGIHESQGFGSLLEYCKAFLGYSDRAAEQRLPKGA
jgi:hypothetical protein